MECRLCHNSEANQTGSHLLSAFLVKSMIGERDNETGFLITKKPELDYRQNKMATPIKEDNILCRGCEQRLSFLESYISNEFTEKLNISKYSANFPITINDSSITYKTCLNVNQNAFSLFIYSVIWRASISSNDLFRPFKLPIRIEENISNMLDNLLPIYSDFKVKTKLKIWLKYIEKFQKDYIWYPFAIITNSEYKTQTNSRNMVFIHPVYQKPFHFLFNEYLILFFESAELFLEDDYFNLKNMHFELDEIVNIDKPLKIGYFSQLEWNKVLDVPKYALVKQKVKEIKQFCSKNFYDIYGRMPVETELKSEVLRYLDSQKT